MGRHRRPSLTRLVAAVGMLVGGTVALLAWLLPPLRVEAEFYRDMPRPVPIPGPSYLPIPP